MAYRINQEPASATYREGGHDGFLIFPVDSGPPRLRRDKDRSNPIVDLTWEMAALNFDSLIYAYRNQHDIEWSIDLVSTEGGYGTYLCRVLPGTFGWRPTGSTTYSVFCTVEVMEKEL